MAVVEEHGGAVEAVPYMKARLVESHRERVARIERGELKVVGQNGFTETEDSPLTAGADGGILTPDPEVERERVEALEQLAGRARRRRRSRKALDELARVAADRGARTSCRRRSRPPRPARRPASGPAVLREAFGDYRAPTGVGGAAPAGRPRAARRGPQAGRRGLRASSATGSRSWSASPGLDGHSNGSEQIALRARDVGMEVVYQGIRLTPEEIAESALQEDVDVVGLSILSGSHLRAGPRGRPPAARRRASTCRWWSAASSPPPTPSGCRRTGVARVYTPKDFEINRIMGEIVELVAQRHGAGPEPTPACADPGPP